MKMHKMRLTLGLLLVVVSGCETGRGLYESQKTGEQFRKVGADPLPVFDTDPVSDQQRFADRESAGEFSSQVDGQYKLGPGDVFTFVVQGRPDVSVNEVKVSPDGTIALPRVGIVPISGMPIQAVTREITERLEPYYESPEVTLIMKVFNNNKVYVLGRVANPGIVHFEGKGSLLEALSLCGGLPVDTARSFLSRCMIVRGKTTIIWIDLKDLLDGGNMALNVRLKNGDIIYIPQSDDQVAYIMGQVNVPGVLHLRSKMTVLDAIMAGGGPADDAKLDKIYVIRRIDDSSGAVEEVNVRTMMAKADFRKNYVLKDGDVVYVPQTGMSKFNYFINQLLPSLTMMNLSLDTAESLGALQEFRKKVWGQDGFINGSD